VSAIISFLTYFSDIGLAAALIQKKEELTDDDLTTTFTVQQLLILTIVVCTLFFSEQISRWYGFDKSGMWLLRSLVISFFLSSLKTIPSILMERKLEFKLLVIPQLFETIFFYGVSVILAWKGFGITSFSWAVLIRGIVGLGIINYLYPWRWRIGIKRSVIRKLLTYGIPFQLNSFLALLKDDLLTIVIGRILPLTELGYIGWAKKWAEMPLRLIMDSVIRVTFPLYSRMQGSKEYLKIAIEKTLYGIGSLVFPLTVIMIIFIRPIALSVPKYMKWEPALLSFSIFAITSLFASISTPMTNALNAIGKIKITLILMVIWTVLTWACSLLGIFFFGYTGVSIAHLIVSFTAPITIISLKRSVPFSFMRVLRWPALCSIIMFITFFCLNFVVQGNILWSIAKIVIGCILYVWLLLKFDSHSIKSVFGEFMNIHL
jgi:O-antigen/teichoic acid export membrane protein